MSKKIIKVNSLPLNPELDACYEIMQNSFNTNQFTHSFFKYPCKFIPEIPRWAIKKYTQPKDKVFDPFCGSGTTALEAIILGRNSFATEIDKVAKLLVLVKTTKLSKNEIIECKKFLDTFSDNYDKSAEFYVPDIRNIDHWFPKENIKKLGFLVKEISLVKNESVQNLLNIIMATIIKKSSYCDNASPKPYVSTKIIKEPEDAFKLFKLTGNKYLDLIIDFSEIKNDNCFKLLDGDALTFKSECEFDLVFTSPPYINAFDYVRTLRLENLWLNMHNEESLLKSKEKYVGTEKINKNEIVSENVLELSPILKKVYLKILLLDSKRAKIILKYFNDMYLNLLNVKNNLKIGSVYGIVVGNNKIKKQIIETSKILEEIATKIGYQTDCRFSYIIKNPYIRIPRNGRGGETKIDYVLCLRRVN